MSGYVYFIAPEHVTHTEHGLQRVKIGYTRSAPAARLTALQCGSPFPLTILAYIDGSQGLERAFHATFAPLWSHGEWFSLYGKLSEFVAEFADTRGCPSREQVVNAARRSIFADEPPAHAGGAIAWNASAEPRHLRHWFPEILP